MFVLISGLPGSGKTTLARRLAVAMNLPLIDKDDILDRLFDSKGIGDAAWRRVLSRESDEIFRREASNSNGAILVSFWHLPGMPADSGTPWDWIRAISDRVVQLQCACDPELAAERFLQRKRHPGHLDSSVSLEALANNLRELSTFGPLNIEPRLTVDTSRTYDIDEIARAIAIAFRRL